MTNAFLSMCILVALSAQLSHAQVPSTISYQGRIQVSGTNFSGTGQFKFAIVSRGTNLSRQATATATVTSGFVTGITVTDDGAGYGATPAVTINDSTGSGASATAQVSGGAVTSITVQNAGSGYTAPTISVAPPPANFVYATYWSNDGTSSGGSQPTSATIASVQEGLVMVLLGDTGMANMTAIPPEVFASPDAYLRIWFNDGVQGFAQLTPDQPLASVGYAMTAARVPASAIASQSIVTDKLAPDAVTSTKIADGTITAADVNALSLGTLFWKLDGNTGTTPGANFVGTTDNQALELKVNGTRALRLEPGAAVNVIAGGPNNTVGPGSVGATVGGGTVQSITANYSTIAGGQSNSVTELHGAIGGGAMNRAGGGLASTVAGGFSNSAIGPYTSVGGGRLNTVLGFVAGVNSGQGNVVDTNADHSVISGGLNNLIDRFSFRAVIAGGGGNHVGFDSDYGTIGGGQNNVIAAACYYSTIAGGQFNDIDVASSYSFVGGGSNNNVAASSPNGVIGGGYSNDISTNSGYSLIGGGYDNNIAGNSPDAVIGGGSFNGIGTNSWGAFVGAGNISVIGANSQNSVIAGGNGNRIDDSIASAIVGGANNNIRVNSDFSFIGAGFDNNIDRASPHSAIAGGNVNDIGTNCSYSLIGGGENNNIGDNSGYSLIVGGRNNDIGTNSDYSFIGAGNNNNIAANAGSSVIAGGSANDIGLNSDFTYIGGGTNNNVAADSRFSTIDGGVGNDIGTNSYHSFIGGGTNNNIAANSFSATIPGGDNNFATNRAFAAGTRAKANHEGAFVWGDSQSVDIGSTNANSVTMRAAGGYRLFSSIAPSAGVYLAPGGGAWTAISDRNAKENFEAIDSRAVLEKVAALPVTMWNYKSQAQEIRHIGPVAQDFKAAFGVGETDTGITTIDADGVALAAIQGLNKKLEEQLKARDAEIQALKEAMAELRTRVDRSDR